MKLYSLARSAHFTLPLPGGYYRTNNAIRVILARQWVLSLHSIGGSPLLAPRTSA